MYFLCPYGELDSADSGGGMDMPLYFFDADTVEAYRDENGKIQSLYVWEKMEYTVGMASKIKNELTGKIDYQVGLVRLDPKTYGRYDVLVFSHFVNGKS